MYEETRSPVCKSQVDDLLTCLSEASFICEAGEPKPSRTRCGVSIEKLEACLELGEGGAQPEGGAGPEAP